MIKEDQGGAETSGDALVGRERELGELRLLARRCRAVTLTGAAGIGKTRLARALIEDLAADYPDGSFIVSLAGLGQADLVPALVAAAIGVAQEPGVALPDSLAGALAPRRLILALDGCEHLAPACARLSQRLLARAPGLLVIATSQEPLGAEGEVAWPVPPLALPPPGPVSAEEAGACDAVRFFAARAAAAAPGFVLSPASIEAVTDICRSLDGLPLAIGLAAARVRDTTAAQLAARLRAGLKRAGGDEAVPARHRILHAALDWAHDRLGPDEQVLLRRLSVFAGWSVDMAEQVCADSGLPAPQIYRLQSGLAAAALIEADQARTGRFRLPAAVREWAATRLALAGETAALHRRLRDWALGVGDFYVTLVLGQVPAHWRARAQLLQRYRGDEDNIRTVLAWCLDHGDIEAGLRLCTAFGAAWYGLGDLAESSRWFGAFLAADQSGVSDTARGPALAAGAWLISQTDPDRAQRQAAAGLEQCRAAGDEMWIAAALTLLAQLALAARQPAAALRYATESAQHAQARGDRWSQALALINCSTAQTMLGELPAARDAAAAAVTLMLEIDHRWGAARTMIGLADLEHKLGQLDPARGHYLAALDLLSRDRADPQITRCLAGLARVALDQDDAAGARAFLERGMAASLRTGSRSGTARTLLACADLAVREGRPDRAVQLAAAATAARSGPPAAAAQSGPPAGSAGLAAAADPAAAPSAQPTRRVRPYLDAAADLGSDKVAQLWADGLCLSPAAAAELAVGRPLTPPEPDSP
jgi:predicted ATPase